MGEQTTNIIEPKATTWREKRKKEGMKTGHRNNKRKRKKLILTGLTSYSVIGGEFACVASGEKGGTAQDVILGSKDRKVERSRQRKTNRQKEQRVGPSRVKGKRAGGGEKIQTRKID